MALIASKLYSRSANNPANIDATNIEGSNANLQLIATNPAIQG